MKQLNRRQSIQLSAAQLSAVSLAGFVGHPSADAVETSKPPTHLDTFALLKHGRQIPVIFDTDIGGDIDDTWALLYMLQCPELDVRLVATDAGKGSYRARLAAKFLSRCGRDEIPIAVGSGHPEDLSHQQDWLGNYNLDAYKGTVHTDAVQAIIDTIHTSDDPVTAICIGAVPNIAEALKRDPTICSKCRFVGMHGAIHVGYGGQPPAVPEANVRSNPAALRDVFAAPWQCSVTPLDTCGIIDLEGDRYAKVLASNAMGIKPLMENYRHWLKRVPWLQHKPDPSVRSTTLFDLVAVYMAFSEELLEMQTLNLRVDDTGMTNIDPSGPEVRCAIQWRDQDAFEDMLVERLTTT